MNLRAVKCLVSVLVIVALLLTIDPVQAEMRNTSCWAWTSNNTSCYDVGDAGEYWGGGAGEYADADYYYPDTGNTFPLDWQLGVSADHCNQWTIMEAQTTFGLQALQIEIWAHYTNGGEICYGWRLSDAQTGRWEDLPQCYC
jgi:hypothetical protein